MGFDVRVKSRSNPAAKLAMIQAESILNLEAAEDNMSERLSRHLAQSV